MQQSLLTTQDNQWLAKHAVACRLGFDFMLADLLHHNSSYQQSRACAVPIFYHGDYPTAGLVVRQIEDVVRHSQVQEQWQARFYEAVMHIAQRLSSFDGRVLIVAAGFGSLTADNVQAGKDGAASEARGNFFAGDEDHS